MLPTARNLVLLISLESLEVLLLEAAFATRYWDCCKAHCSWKANLFGQSSPLGTCSKEDVQQHDPNIVSGCVSASSAAAFTCHDNIPWAVTSTLAYGFAAVPASGDICGSCFELTFTGQGQHGPNAGAADLKGKVMVVQATNIGHDVANEQFNVMIPGGGVGAFDACSYQWGVSKDKLGVQYGGFLSACQQLHGYNAAHEAYKKCVLQKCDDVFGNNKFPQFFSGCKFFVDWYEAADNPMLTHRQVPCPPELVQISGMSRKAETSPVARVTAEPSVPVTVAEPKDCAPTRCGCNWATKSTCATDDGTVCNKACCCRFRQQVLATSATLAAAVAPMAPMATVNATAAATKDGSTACSCLWATDTTCAIDDGTLCNKVCCCWFRKRYLAWPKNQTRPKGSASSTASSLRSLLWILVLVMLNPSACL